MWRALKNGCIFMWIADKEYPAFQDITTGYHCRWYQCKGSVMNWKSKKSDHNPAKPSFQWKMSVQKESLNHRCDICKCKGIPQPSYWTLLTVWYSTKHFSSSWKSQQTTANICILDIVNLDKVSKQTTIWHLCSTFSDQLRQLNLFAYFSKSAIST